MKIQTVIRFWETTISVIHPLGKDEYRRDSRGENLASIAAAQNKIRRATAPPYGIPYK